MKAILALALLLASAAAAHAITMTSTLTISGQSNVTYNDLTISTTSGPCIIIDGSTNVNITASHIGPCGTNNTNSDSQGIYIRNNSSNINIYDSYIHVENLASVGGSAICGASHDGILVYNNGTGAVNIKGNVIAFNQVGVHIYAFDGATAKQSSNVTVNGNYLFNQRGAPDCASSDNAYGHVVQSYNDSVGGINTGITFTNNYSVCRAGVGDAFDGHCSDVFNVGFTSNAVMNDNYSTMDSNQNSFQCGIIFDSGSTGGEAKRNILQQYNCGIGLSAGTNYTIDSNKVLIFPPSTSFAAGISLNGATCTTGTITITNNIVTAFQGAGPLSSDPWNQAGYNSGSCATGANLIGVTTGSNMQNSGGGNVLDTTCQYTNDSTCAAYFTLYPLASTNPPPAIPPVPVTCVISSTYSTQTSKTSCANQVQVTFAFPSDAQSFVATPAASATLSWTGGTLQSDLSVRNKANQASRWDRTLTYQAMGVPAGATVNAITGGSAQSQATFYTSPGATHQAGAVTLTDGATVATLSAARNFTATDAAMVTTNGTDLNGLSLPASNSAAIRINNTLSTANVVGAHMAVKQDNLTFTLTYTPAASAVPGSMVTVPFPGRL